MTCSPAGLRNGIRIRDLARELMSEPMSERRILIDPVTRIEGHAKITIHLAEDGRIADARLHITQLRGFEKLCENRPFYEMPSLMARICGICPVSHLIASSKACDAILGVNIPPNAARLRRKPGAVTASSSPDHAHARGGSESPCC